MTTIFYTPPLAAQVRKLQTGMDVPALKKETIVYIHPDVKAEHCPCCGAGEMFVIMRFGANAPPFQKQLIR